jgi:hypothetical protein
MHTSAERLPVRFMKLYVLDAWREELRLLPHQYG